MQSRSLCSSRLSGLSNPKSIIRSGNCTITLPCVSGEVMDYSSKTTGPYPETRQVISGVGISTPQYSTARMTPPPGPQYGVGSVLRSSNGVVYSSVATPIPSTFAITTQPGSIFSKTMRDLSGVHTTDAVTSLSALHQSQPMPRSITWVSFCP